VEGISCDLIVSDI